MITDLGIAKICAGTYGDAGKLPIAWDHFFTGDADADDTGIAWGLIHLNGVDVVAFRGSTTPLDWMRDLDAIAKRPFDHWELGFVHAGFYRKMNKVGEALAPMLKQPAVVTGHSLGAARADILAGLMVVAGVTPRARVVFGEPRPGFQKLADILAPVPGRSYRARGAFVNGIGHDLITDVPVRTNLLDYVHPTPPIDLEVQAAADDPWSVFCYHHMAGYIAGLESLANPPTI